MKKHIGQIICIMVTLLITINVSLTMSFYTNVNSTTNPKLSLSQEKTSNKQFTKKVTSDNLLIFEKEGTENETEVVTPYSFPTDGFPLSSTFEFIFNYLDVKEKKNNYPSFSFVESSHVPFWILDCTILI